MTRVFLSLVLINSLLVFSTSCKDNTPDDNSGLPTSGMYILNEGSFTAGDATIDLISGGEKSESIFQSANAAQPLGSILQSGMTIGEEVFLAVNVSGTIEVVDKSDFTSLRTINMASLSGTPIGGQPRYMAHDGQYLYVTNSIFSGPAHISKVNPITGTVVDTFQTPSWCEPIIYKNSNLYVGVMYDQAVQVVDPNTGNLVQSISVGEQPSSMQFDANGDLWVLCQGDFYGTFTPELYKIDATTHTVSQVLAFPAGVGNPSRLTISQDLQTMYYTLGGDVYKMAITDTALPTAAFVDETDPIYGIGINAAELWAAFAGDFTNPGSVQVYEFSGALKATYPAGVAPSSFMER